VLALSIRHLDTPEIRPVFMKTIIILLCVFQLSACALIDVYTRGQAQTLRMGVVESMREVRITGTRSLIGSTLGTVAGVILGNMIGQGGGRTAASIVGAVMGGVLGSSAEEVLNRLDGTQIIIVLEDGSRIAVVQEKLINEIPFKVGQTVHVDESAGYTIISH
jgi:outer membrane lipoprotein SlyB